MSAREKRSSFFLHGGYSAFDAERQPEVAQIYGRSLLEFSRGTTRQRMPLGGLLWVGLSMPVVRFDLAGGRKKEEGKRGRAFPFVPCRCIPTPHHWVVAVLLELYKWKGRPLWSKEVGIALVWRCSYISLLPNLLSPQFFGLFPFSGANSTVYFHMDRRKE